MEAYARGDGHIDLANKLNISNTTSLAVPGSCNNRIIRTTLKDSYCTTEKTLYIIGVTFLGRIELPINREQDAFEGRWLSFQNTINPNHRYVDWWNAADVKTVIDLKLKTELSGNEDQLENLMYQLLSMVGDLKSRGHQILIFRQVDNIYNNLLSKEKFIKLKNYVNIIDGLKWKAINWQHEQGIKFNPEDINLGFDVRHPLPGEHDPLNTFLLDYIKKYNLNTLTQETRS